MALQTSYNTGTATINAGETIVTGAGTGWLNFGLRDGDLFWAAGLSVRIASIESNTKMTLAYPWPGASRNAQNYEVRVTPDTSRVLVNARSLLDSLTNGVLSALSGMGNAANKIAYFAGNGVVALADFPAAARAFLAGGVLPNGQLPERLRTFDGGRVTNCNLLVETGEYFVLNGSQNLPDNSNWYITVISQNETGTAVRQIARRDNNNDVFERYIWYGAWTAWRRTSAPERGSNANGEYVRFADGTQICTGSFVGYGANVTTAVTLPAAFVTSFNAAYASIQPLDKMDTDYLVWCDDGYRLKYQSTSASTQNKLNYCVIGRWYP